MKRVTHLLIIPAIVWLPLSAFCQRTDSIPHRDPISGHDTIPSFIKGTTPNPNTRPSKHVDSPYKTDSATRKHHDPRKATLYSTFCPGLGQIYNKKYWKVPLVAAALGIPAYLYFDNRKEYRNAQYAISVILNYYPMAVPDSVLQTVEPRLQHAVTTGDPTGLRSYRDTFRQYQDYSVIFFVLFWGLQIVDATVDAHLKEFDVSDQLSLRIAPSSPELHLPGAGISLVLDIHQPRSHRVYSFR